MTPTFLDANILILAYKGEDPELKAKAQRILTDHNRIFIASPFLSLEVQPYSRDAGEAEFLRSYFDDQVNVLRGDLQRIVQIAFEEAERYQIKAMDALHVAAAWLAGATELVTAENKTAAIFRSRRIKVVHIADVSI